MLKTLPGDVQDSDGASVFRVDKGPCAKSLASGKMAYHNSNGTFVGAYKGGKAIYLACANIKCKIMPDDAKEGQQAAVQLINKYSENCVQEKDGGEPITFEWHNTCTTWVRLTEEGLKTLLEDKSEMEVEG